MQQNWKSQVGLHTRSEFIQTLVSLVRQLQHPAPANPSKINELARVYELKIFETASSYQEYSFGMQSKLTEIRDKIYTRDQKLNFTETQKRYLPDLQNQHASSPVFSGHTGVNTYMGIGAGTSVGSGSIGIVNSAIAANSRIGSSGLNNNLGAGYVTNASIGLSGLNNNLVAGFSANSGIGSPGLNSNSRPGFNNTTGFSNNLISGSLATNSSIGSPGFNNNSSAGFANGSPGFNNNSSAGFANGSPGFKSYPSSGFNANSSIGFNNNSSSGFTINPGIGFNNNYNPGTRQTAADPMNPGISVYNASSPFNPYTTNTSKSSMQTLNAVKTNLESYKPTFTRLKVIFEKLRTNLILPGTSAKNRPDFVLRFMNGMQKLTDLYMRVASTTEPFMNMDIAGTGTGVDVVELKRVIDSVNLSVKFVEELVRKNGGIQVAVGGLAINTENNADSVKIKQRKELAPGVTRQGLRSSVGHVAADHMKEVPKMDAFTRVATPIVGSPAKVRGVANSLSAREIPLKFPAFMFESSAKVGVNSFSTGFQVTNEMAEQLNENYGPDYILIPYNQ